MNRWHRHSQEFELPDGERPSDGVVGEGVAAARWLRRRLTRLVCSILTHPRLASTKAQRRITSQIRLLVFEKLKHQPTSNPKTIDSLESKDAMESLAPNTMPNSIVLHTILQLIRLLDLSGWAFDALYWIIESHSPTFLCRPKVCRDTRTLYLRAIKELLYKKHQVWVWEANFLQPSSSADARWRK